VQSGKFKFDTPLAKLFPDQAAGMSPEIAQATLVHVLSHHTGIPDLDGQTWWDLQRSKGDIVQKRREVARRVLAAKPTSRPGTTFGYANANHVLAASLAESVTGKTWEELVQTAVFDPLDMKTAGFGPMASAGRTDQPWSHTAKGEPIEPDNSDNPPILGPAGRVHCSLPDWSKFIADQLRAAVGGKALVNPPMNRTLFRAPFEKHGYAIAGWLTAEREQGTVLAHAGSNTNNYATAWLYPEKARAILVASNQGGPDGPGQKACDEATQALQSQIFGR
jgi:CubicO group peptidase (beta-lactamase class C family)